MLEQMIFLDYVQTHFLKMTNPWPQKAIWEKMAVNDTI